ncbi:MAG: ABC transporter permease subunit/CPBP intramembrane protease [Pirellulaceae bacterium]
MNFYSVLLIFRREFRDQIRDRRTLFTIIVLPVFLYPLMGMLFLQITQFMQQHPTQVRIVGAGHLPDSPRLLNNNQFSEAVLPENLIDLVELEVLENSSSLDSELLRDQAQEQINRGEIDAVVFIPPDFSDQLDEFRSQLRNRQLESQNGVEDSALPPMPVLPKPTILFNAASDRSLVAHDRVQRALKSWRELMVDENLLQSHVPKVATRPFEVEHADVASPIRRRAAMWSKVLPFIVLVWALTGAFYPAIDLCAGEKERGTLETLLSGPALRSEIVWGKLLTVMAFSVATAVLNLSSLGFTAILYMRQFSAAGATLLAPPPLSAILWLAVAIIPCAALFSALALAIASFAKSSKEGQYYLLPLLMFCLPLMALSLMPSAELNLGTSLIPLTGLMLLLRVAIEGRIVEALPLLPVIAVVTGGCCCLAIRWAIAQFENENVLFGENEQVSVIGMVKNIWRDRVATPTLAQAIFGGFLLLAIRFIASTFASAPTSWGGFVQSMLVTQIGFIAAPAIVLTLLLSRKRLQTLAIHKLPKWWTIPAAAAMAVCLHPTALWIHRAISHIYPPNPAVLDQLQPIQLLLQSAPLLQVILLIALLPAICEELAFRGFLLSGLRSQTKPFTAIVIASLFFGFTHGIIQQSIFAAMLGVVIGLISVRTGSLLPAIAFHFTNNALMLAASRISTEGVIGSPLGRALYYTEATTGGTALVPHWHVTIIGALLACLILGRFRSQRRSTSASFTSPLAKSCERATG